MQQIKIFIVGSGKLANAILTAQFTIESCQILPWESKYQTINEKAILIHAGSGRQLKECFDFCEKTNSTFIELSTGLETETMTPSFPLIICPNTSILVLKTLNMLKISGGNFAGYQIKMTESHQSTKTTEPGTAYAFAQSLKLPVNEINSVRDPEIQKNKLGIPEEYLGKHAYHKIVINNGSDEITIETKVLGHQSYASGVKTIIETVLKSQLENKRYSILEIIDNPMH
jgi:dihydrodipicolinate reductase